MVCTMPSGMKWWLLRHGIVDSVLGAFLLILFIFTVIFSGTLSTLVFSGSALVFSGSALVFLVFMLSGFAYSDLYAAIKELPPSWVAEDFDLIRVKVTLREGTKEYVVLYHSRFAPYTYGMECG